MSRRPLHIVTVSSEVHPFAKTGGLADVAGALPRALARLGHQNTVILPGYRKIDQRKFNVTKTGQTITCSIEDVSHRINILKSDHLPGINTFLSGSSGLLGPSRTLRNRCRRLPGQRLPLRPFLPGRR